MRERERRTARAVLLGFPLPIGERVRVRVSEFYNHF